MEFIDKRPEGKHHTKPGKAMEITADMLAAAGGVTSAIVAAEIRKRDDACFEEIAAVLRKYFPDDEYTGPFLRDRLNKLLAAEQRLLQSDCAPTCAEYPRCHHNQGRHGVVRINCPLWRPKG